MTNLAHHIEIPNTFYLPGGEPTLEERQEAARARLKTAYDLYDNCGLDDPRRDSYKEKWQARKRELNLLLSHELNSSL
jgi:hypothetical protein